MSRAGVANVVELDWWAENALPDKSDVSFVLTPAQHWSKRTLTDDNRALWGSWTVVGPKHRFFFAGDTAYCDVFRLIGHLYGPFDLTALPIGAYEVCLSASAHSLTLPSAPTLHATPTRGATRGRPDARGPSRARLSGRSLGDFRADVRALFGTAPQAAGGARGGGA